MSVVVFGGYGVFGSHISRELARLGVSVIVAGRDGAKAEALARALPGAHRGLAADVTREADLGGALSGAAVAVSCAGPFSEAGTALLEACLATGCHYVDIAEERAHAARVRTFGDRFRARGLSAVTGCSSLPGLSGALALFAANGAASRPKRARVTLFIGNRNPKGSAAIRSVVGTLGKPIPAPQGTLRGFGDPEVVSLPAPFGRRKVFTFESPEYDLFPALLSVTSVSVKVAFELRLATATFAWLARRSADYGERTARTLDGLGRLVRSFGSSGGAVQTELFFEDGSMRRAVLFSATEGQRMVALPAALAAEALVRRPDLPRGAMAVYELLGTAELLHRIEAEGFELISSSS
jgi:hypothetical protein